ncbi:MAG: bifunctional oligoribonuclease/PAP phosphatase NrnA [Candidatus Coatesbacteria bacterium]|nr:bifunctional oligoribonuclease/PAP phosphatase NrnA [Candidatus Coatesbacteria bacterium]
MLSFEKIREIIEDYSEILIVTHKKPDGDAIASSVAWYYRLSEFSVNKKISLYINSREIPFEYKFLTDKVKIVQDDYMPSSDYIILALDTASKDRLVLPQIDIEKVDIINIDHHISNENFGRWNHVIGNSSSASEVTAKLFLEHKKFSRNEAEALYLGILTDTGQFSYSLTSSETLKMASILVEAGADPVFISENAYFTKSLAYWKLLAQAITEATKIDNVLIFCITSEMLIKHDMKISDLEQLSSYTIRNRETELGIVLVGMNNDETTKCSFRSKGRFDVNEFARRWDGGGHKSASGAYIKRPLFEVKNEIISAVKEICCDKMHNNRQ